MRVNYRPFWNYFNNLEIQKALIADEKRLQAYQQAICAKVKKGDVVIDLGAGLGIFSIMAVRSGASKVYAIEAMPIIEKAKAIANDNGVSDRIDFINDSSQNVSLPHKADVLVSEILGELGIDEGLLDFTKDAYRFLKPKAKLIPESIDLFLVPFESQEFYSSFVGFWDESVNGIKFNTLKDEYHLRPIQVDFAYDYRYLSEPVKFAGFNLSEIKHTSVGTTVSFKIQSEGIIHGFLGFFRATLAKGVALENTLEAQMSCWRNLCFPVNISGKGLHVKKYDSIKMNVSAVPTDDVIDWNLKFL